jgi:F-type H+-transporting ATPase subunit delta
VASGAARRYARAVFELAQQGGDIDEWRRRLTDLREILAVPELRAIVANPALGPQRRLEAIDRIGADRLGAEGRNLAKLLVEAHQVETIDEITEEFERLDDEQAGRVRAVATTAVPLGSEDRERLVSDLSRRLGRDVRLDVRVDPHILGGLVLQTGDRLVDASVRSRLQQLRRQLANV